MKNREMSDESLETRFKILIKTAENLQPVFQQMGPDDPKFPRFADFVNGVLQLQKDWLQTDEGLRSETVDHLEKMGQELLKESSEN